MRDLRVGTCRAAVADLWNGATIMMGGFGGAGLPRGLVKAVVESGVCNLTVISNNAGADSDDLSLWFEADIVRKMICSYPRSAKVFSERYRQGKVELELVPQGTLIERIRCGGAGLGGFLSPVGVGTLLAEGKETKVVGGKEYILELPLHADFALLRAHKADPAGNLTYSKTARNYSPVMATAAKTVIVEVDQIVELGGIHPEEVVTPSIFVDRIVLREGAK